MTHGSGNGPTWSGPLRAGRPWHWTAVASSWRGSLIGFAVIFALYCFLNLGGHSVISMEPMVIDSGRTMVESGNWAVPYLYGEIHTFKPALAYWISAATQLVFDQPTEFQLRAPFALSAVVLGLGLMVLIGREVGPRAGLFSALAAVGTPLVLEKVRIAEFDLPLTAGVGLAVAAATVNLARARDSLPLWILGYVSLAVGFLAKGTPAVMVYTPGLLVAALFTASFKRLFSWRHLVGALLGGSLIAGYVWWAYSVDGAVIFDQPRLEATSRALRWTTVPVLRTLSKPLMILVAFLPWSAVLLLAKRSREHASSEQWALVRAAIGFLAGGVIPFVLVAAHEMRYYLPLAASMGIAVGVLIDLQIGREVPRRFATAMRGLFVMIAAVAVVAAFLYEPSRWILVVLAAAALGALTFWRRDSRGASLATVLLLISCMTLVAEAYVLVVGRARTRDLSSVAAELRDRLPPSETLWVVGPADPAGKYGSLYYHLSNRVRTFCGTSPPVEASYLLLVDEQRDAIDASVPLEDLAHVEGGGYSFLLARNALAGSADTETDQARCELSDYLKYFEG